jgi:lactate dehydrogenase-like 2-hydroxyacid dehydrogenase
VKVAIFSAKKYDREFLSAANSARHGVCFFDDVYEEEEEIFFEDRSGLILSDDVFARLLTFPNVIITGHQAFFTREALLNIAGTTIENITKFENNQPLEKLAG